MQMTRNEYQKFMKECAERYWNESGYGWKRYKADLDAVEILPLDLSKYPLIQKETEKWINKLFNEETTDRKGQYMLRGFTNQEGSEVALLNLSYGDYSESINFWAYNDTEQLIYTYCEGDTTLKMFDTKESYEAEKQENCDWYREYYS